MAFLEQNRGQNTDSGSNTVDQGISFSCKDIESKTPLYLSQVFLHISQKLVIKIFH